MRLSEQTILSLMKEVYTEKLREFASNTKIDGNESNVISQGLKVRHKSSRFLYTVVKVRPEEVVLKTPEGKEFLLDTHSLENEYEIA